MALSALKVSFLCLLQMLISYLYAASNTGCSISSHEKSKAMSETMHWKTSCQDPEGHGWIKKAGALAVEWLRQKLAPELVLEFVSCKCKKNKCSNGMCDCFMVDLSCTNVCRCFNCANGTFAQDEEQREGEKSGSGDDSSDDDLSANEQN